MDARQPKKESSDKQPEGPQVHAPDPPPLRPQRGVLVFPFVVAAGLTILLLIAMGRPIEGTWIIVPLLAGAIAAASSLAWSITKRPHSASAVTHGQSAPAKKNKEARGEGDPLAHIHAVEHQARRQQKPCPNCGTQTGADKPRCPNCDHVFLVECKGCRTKVRLDWGACPECGRSLP